MSVDLPSMTIPELKALVRRAEKAIEARLERNRKDARAAVEKVAKNFGLSISEIVSEGPDKAPRKRRKNAAAPAKKGRPKFANPADRKQTWTGKGRRPVWYVEAIENGKSPDDLAI